MPPPAWAPTTADVKALLPRRLGGVADFSASTIPTATQVTGYIEGVVAEIGTLGQLPVEHEDLAKEVVRYGAAAVVELLYWPEQSRKPDSVYEELEEEFERLKALLMRVIPGDVAGEGDVPGPPRYAFPEPEEGWLGVEETFHPLGTERL